MKRSVAIGAGKVMLAGAGLALAATAAWFAARPGPPETRDAGGGETAIIDQRAGGATTRPIAKEDGIAAPTPTPSKKTSDGEPDAAAPTAGGVTGAGVRADGEAARAEAGSGTETAKAPAPDAKEDDRDRGRAPTVAAGGEGSGADKTSGAAGATDPEPSPAGDQRRVTTVPEGDVGPVAALDQDAARSGTTGAAPGASPAGTGGAPEAADRPAADPDTPAFDIVRIDPDGQTVLAGNARPNQRVEILLDGEVVETVETDGTGTFVTVVQTDLNEKARNLQLRVPAPETAVGSAAVTETARNEGSESGTGTPRDPETVAARDDSAVEGSAATPADGANDRDGATPETAKATGDATAETKESAGPASDEPEVLASIPPLTGAVRNGAPIAAPAADGTVTRGATSSRPEGSGVPAGAVTTPDVSEEPELAEPDRTALRTPGLPVQRAESAADAQARPGAPDQPLATTRATTEARLDLSATEVTPRAPARSADRRFLTSAPVIILPSAEPAEAPTVLSSTPADLKVLQPSVSDINSVVLDRISYGETGDVVLSGRGRAGRAVRVYGNGLLDGTTRVATDGTWSMSIEEGRGRQIKLLRLDELDPKGAVTTRIEAPFNYVRTEPKLVRQREVVIERGDVLWRIAEQHYGAGLRYSVIYGANSKLIRDPNLIYPGQVFSVPELIDAEPEAER